MGTWQGGGVHSLYGQAHTTSIQSSGHVRAVNNVVFVLRVHLRELASPNSAAQPRAGANDKPADGLCTC